jgi:hypothetical protein
VGGLLDQRRRLLISKSPGPPPAMDSSTFWVPSIDASSSGELIALPAA